jgi:hypothetical protein
MHEKNQFSIVKWAEFTVCGPSLACKTDFDTGHRQLKMDIEIGFD